MWKPVYKYQPSSGAKIRVAILLGLSGFMSLVTILSEEYEVGMIFLAILSIVSVYSYLSLSKIPKNIRQTLRKEKIEFYEKTVWKNLWFVRNNVNLVGVFNPYKRNFYLPAQYCQIITRNNYLFLEKEGKWGVVNTAIGEQIVPCEYDNISYNEQNGNVIVSKGTKRIEMSPYGSPIKEYDVRDEISKIFDKIIDSSGK